MEATRPDLRMDDLKILLEDPQRLHRNHAGEAVFTMTEPWLEGTIVGDGRGHFVAHCVARDDFAEGRELHFAVSFNQTMLASTLSDLDGVLAAFPVIGHP